MKYAIEENDGTGWKLSIDPKQRERIFTRESFSVGLANLLAARYPEIEYRITPIEEGQ